MTIIAISGACRSGKTYLGSQLSNALDIPAFAYADRIKEVTDEAYPDWHDAIYADNKTPEARQLLIDVGKKLRDENGEDYFIRSVHDQIKQLGNGIITDIRFRSELSSFQDEFPSGKIIFVGPLKDEYHIEDIYNVADLHLPAKPIKNLTQLSRLIKLINA